MTAATKKVTMSRSAMLVCVLDMLCVVVVVVVECCRSVLKRFVSSTRAGFVRGVIAHEQAESVALETKATTGSVMTASQGFEEEGGLLKEYEERFSKI